MNCIAIDDEPLALEIIKTYCKKIEFISLAGAYINPMDAIKEIKLQNIDLIFLDLQMPNLTGFSFLKTLINPPLVIITTAYPEHALNGRIIVGETSIPIGDKFKDQFYEKLKSGML